MSSTNYTNFTSNSNLTSSIYNLTVLNETMRSSFPQSYTKAGAIEITFLVFLMIVIIFGNSMVCLAFSSVDRQLRTVTNYFVINLALSDILVGTFSMSFWLCIRTGTIQYSETAGTVYMAFDILCGAASILNLTLISVERTIAVKFPAKHRNLSRNRPIIHGGIASVWIISIILAVLFGFALPALTRTRHLILMLVIITFVIPTMIIIFSYVTIFHSVKTRESFHHTLRYEVRLAAMIGIVIILFLLCWFPFFLFNLLAEYCSCWSASFSKLIPAVKYLHYSNSTMNPIIYAYRNSDYRRAFKKLFYKFMTCGRFARYETRSERAMSARSTLASQAQSAYRETVLAKEPVEGEKFETDCVNGFADEKKPLRNGTSR
ncbi:D(2) dopamine receptor A-like isoform X2 [Rhopilema esculentum]|eukprot:gene11866-2414_t